MIRSIVIDKTITKRNDSINKYFNMIAKYPLLTQDEEYELSVAAKKGDNNARLKLITSNLRFVVSVAKQYHAEKLELSDLIDAGNEGLIKAIDRFDPTRGLKIITYAVWWIRQSIIAFISENDSIVYLPGNQQSILRKVEKIISDYSQDISKDADVNDVLHLFDENEIKYNASTLKSALMASKDSASLNDPVGFDSELMVVDLLQSETTEFEDVDNKHDGKYIIEKMMNTLSPKMQDIVKMHYGIGMPDGINYSNNQIAEKYGQSSEYIRLILIKAHNKMKKIAKVCDFKNQM